MPIEYITFRKKPILKITQENSFTKVQIGLKKALLILQNIEAIRVFIDKNTSPGFENKPSEATREVNPGAEI